MALAVTQLRTREVLELCAHVPGLTFGEVLDLQKSGDADDFEVVVRGWSAEKGLRFFLAIQWVEARRERPGLTFDEFLDEPEPETPADDEPVPPTKRKPHGPTT
jgi:hypothetical protein